MRCMACGAEMTLTDVVADDTMAVSGFEHQTFRCSQCQDVETRLVFTRHDGESGTASMPEQPRAMDSPQTVPAEPAPAAAVEETPIAPAQSMPTVEPTQTAPAEPTFESRPPHRSQPTLWEKALEKLTTLKVRASDTDRTGQFNRFWDSLRSPRSDSDC